MKKREKQAKLATFVMYAAIVTGIVAVVGLAVQFLGIVPSWMTLFHSNEQPKPSQQENTSKNRSSIENNVLVFSPTSQNNVQGSSNINHLQQMSLKDNSYSNTRITNRIIPSNTVEQSAETSKSQIKKEIFIGAPKESIEKPAKVNLSRVLHKNESIDLDFIDFSVKHHGFHGSGDKIEPLLRIKMPNQKPETILDIFKGWSRTFESGGKLFVFTLEDFDNKILKVSLIEN